MTARSKYILMISFLFLPLAAKCGDAAQYDQTVYSLGKLTRAADVIVIGQVSAIEQTKSWILNRIAVEDVLKGNVSGSIVVKTSRLYQAGPLFRKGEQCGLFLQQTREGDYMCVFDAYGKVEWQAENEADAIADLRRYVRWGNVPQSNVPYDEMKAFLLRMIQSANTRVRMSACQDLIHDARTRRHGLRASEQTVLLQQMKEEPAFSPIKASLVDVLRQARAQACAGQIADLISEKMSSRLKMSVGIALGILAKGQAVSMIAPSLSAAKVRKRANAAEILARTALPEAVPMLKTLLADSDEQVRVAAVMGLCIDRNGASQRLYEVATQDASPRVQKAAMQALARLHTVEAKACLKDLTTQAASPMLRTYAQAALKAANQ